MGPIALFDKSFLESLSIDESVWFDNFFYPNICPVLFMESLADLAKDNHKTQTTERRLQLLANKFAELSGGLNAHHSTLCIAELTGHQVPMTGQIPRSGGHYVRHGERTGVVFESSPEEDALARWEDAQFLEVERRHARKWREALEALDLKGIADYTRKLGVDGKSCTSLGDAKALANAIMSGSTRHFDRIALTFAVLPELLPYRQQILERWSLFGYKPLSIYAPYTSFCVKIELFFRFALASDHISWQRASNRRDVAYLYYLPFCMVFISGDKLHRKCAPLFMRDNQSFTWGPDLKADLARMNSYFLELPEETQNQSIMSFARVPPAPPSTIVRNLWDTHMPRASERIEASGIPDKSAHDQIVQQIRNLADSDPEQDDSTGIHTGDLDNMVVKRKVRRRKGSWWQVPPDAASEEG